MDLSKYAAGTKKFMSKALYDPELAKGLPVYVVNNIDRVGEMLDRIVRLTRGRD